MAKAFAENTMTPEQVEEMLQWFNGELKKVSDDIREYEKKKDYIGLAKAEGMRDTYMRCIKKLHQLEESKA